MLAAARTKHGDHGAARRAMHRDQRSVIVRCRLLAAAYRLGAYLPPEIVARMAFGVKQVAPRPDPSQAQAAPPGSSAPRVKMAGGRL
jgi:thioester reductase-like protein